ncbi:MAG: hypothetical protein LBR77_00515 [Lachnospiraceae bacterium]|nr:hypothetical protein [Lachnospiraceae bacterium]
MVGFIRKIIILANIFIATLMIYSVWSLGRIDKAEVAYTPMEDATLPLIAINSLGYRMNELHGHLQEMDSRTGRDPLTVLGPDRRLALEITGSGKSPVGIRYEIRNLTLDQLVERTMVESWVEQDGTSYVTLPIQNLLTENQEYLLHLFVDTEVSGTLHYYTRIVCADNERAKEMVDLAVGFSDKSLDYERARELTVYLETNARADNSTLGKVTLENSYAQLTWGGLKVDRVGDLRVTMLELDGIMAQVRVDYLVTSLEREDELYEVTDVFTMKWNAQRIYMMDYERSANQIFLGGEDVYAGRRIMLGVMNEGQMQVVKSPSQSWVVFVANRELICYNQSVSAVGPRPSLVFSFRDFRTDENGRAVPTAHFDARNDYPEHGIRIVDVTNEGDIYFLVYGYMNRGAHEGMMGVALYRYTQGSQPVLEERFFMPKNQSFERISADVDRLHYMKDLNQFYLWLDQAIYAVDIVSGEYMVVAENIKEEDFFASWDFRYIAWQQGGGSIHWMDLENGAKQELRPEQGGASLQPLGFVGYDFVYGHYLQADIWKMHGLGEERPLYALQIVDENLQAETRYEQRGRYLLDVAVSGERIHMDRYAKEGGGWYRFVDRDTIVCNVKTPEGSSGGVGYYASKEREKLYFVQLDSVVSADSDLTLVAPELITYDNSVTLRPEENLTTRQSRYIAYVRGRYAGASEDFADVVAWAYDDMGVVVDASQRMVWNRVNRRNAVTIDHAETAARPLVDESLMETVSAGSGARTQALKAYGCPLRSLFYLIDKGIPVAAYTDARSYVLIYGYDANNISIFDPVANERSKMEIEDATAHFEALGNDFVAGVRVDGNN